MPTRHGFPSAFRPRGDDTTDNELCNLHGCCFLSSPRCFRGVALGEAAAGWVAAACHQVFVQKRDRRWTGRRVGETYAVVARRQPAGDTRVFVGGVPTPADRFCHGVCHAVTPGWYWMIATIRLRVGTIDGQPSLMAAAMASPAWE